MNMSFLDNRKHIRTIVFILPILLTIAIAMIYCCSEPFYELILDKQYDRCVYGPLFFLNTLLVFLITVNLYKRKLYFCFAIYTLLFIALLFLSLELIHWGQLIINYDTFFFEKENQIFHQMSVTELVKLRNLFYAAIFFIGFYGTFLWFIFYKKQRKRLVGMSRLFVPDANLCLYFFPIVFLFFSAVLISYLSYQSHKNLISIDEYSWLFELIRADMYFFRIFLAIGLLIFFSRNLWWIKTVETIQPPYFWHSLKLLIAFTIVFVLFSIFFVIFFENYGLYNLFTANARFYELKSNDEVAITQYHVIVKYGQNDDYVNMKLSLLSHRTGNDEDAFKYLAESLVKRLKNNRLIINVRVSGKEGAGSRDRSVIFNKGEGYDFVLKKIMLLYQYLYAFNLEDAFIQDVTKFVFNSLTLGRNRIEIELSI